MVDPSVAFHSLRQTGSIARKWLQLNEGEPSLAMALALLSAQHWLGKTEGDIGLSVGGGLDFRVRKMARLLHDPKHSYANQCVVVKNNAMKIKTRSFIE